MFRRENTFRIDYSNVPRKPTFSDVHQFIAIDLGLTRDQVVRLQINKTLGCAFVKTVDLATAQKVVEEEGEKHEIVVDDKVYPLRISMEDGAVEVKLSDLSEGVSNATIAQFLSTFGEVISIHELLWGEDYHFESISTGTRVARMMVKKNIPSFVTIDSEIAAISYFGQRQTCRHCGEFVHNGVSCVTNKKLLTQKLATNETYANVTKQLQQAQPKTVPKLIEKDPEMGPPKPTQPPKPKGPANQPGQTKQPGTDGASLKQADEKSMPIFQKRTPTTDPKNTDSLQQTIPALLPANDDDEQMQTTGGEDSDASAASVSSKDARNLRNKKKQKTKHGDSSQHIKK